MTSARGLFICGTDTGVGKTQMVTIILRELAAQSPSVGAYKPVCSGAEIAPDGTITWDDLQRLQRALPQTIPIERLCSQRFLAPLAPPLAAAREGRVVDVAAVEAGLAWWQTHVEHLVIEGAGGWLCPLTPSSSLADWVATHRYPTLIVARCGLGTINHTLLTIEAIRRRKLPIAGVILNQSRPEDEDQSAQTNASEIEARSGVPVLGEVGWNETELRRGGRRITIHWPNLMLPPSMMTGSRLT
jgi:dethiobiotin synthetase